MPPSSVILVDAGAGGRGGAPRRALGLDGAARQVAARGGRVALAVWLGAGRAEDARVRALVKTASLPSISIGREEDRRGASRSAALGFAVHLRGPVGAAEAARCLARLLRPARRPGRAPGARAVRRLKILSDVTRAANSVLDPRRVMEIVMSKAQSLVRSEAWSLLLVDEKEQSLTFEISKGGRAGAMRDFKLQIGQGIAGWVVQYRRPAILNDVRRDRRFEPRFDVLTGFTTRSILCAPLISRGRIIGVVELLNKIGGRFTKDDLAILKLLVEPGAIAIENAILYKRSTELSFTDDLTQLFNARYLHLALRREIKRAKRYGQPVSLIFLDLDGFKKVNDSHGHLTGSRALVEVGQVIQHTVREIDIVSRYGGDEFTIVLPQTGPEGAVVIAERVRRSIEERVFLAEMGHEVKLTASFGVACYPEHGQSREDLIQQADKAMYEIKDGEKNGVALAR